MSRYTKRSYLSLPPPPKKKKKKKTSDSKGLKGTNFKHIFFFINLMIANKYKLLLNFVYK